MQRVFLPILLGLLFFSGLLPSAAAQLPPPPPVPPVPPLEDTVDDVVQTAEEVVQTAEEAGSVGGGAAGGAVASVQESTSTGAQVQDAQGATAHPGSGKAGAGRGSAKGRVGASARTPHGSPATSARPEELYSGQARLPVTVVKTNDANRDSAYSDAEATPVPGADVTFKITVTNHGTEEVSITRTTDFFPGPDGVADRQVCQGLDGRTLVPGESVTCMFTLSSYAPPRGETRVNTISVQMLAGDGTGSSMLRTILATDASTVRTSATDVLGLVLGQPGEGGLAGTGAALGSLGGLAVLLAAAGAELLRRGRARSSVRQTAASAG